SVISYQLSTINHQLLIISYQLSVISYQPSTINHQLLIINHHGFFNRTNSDHKIRTSIFRLNSSTFAA
ncbi:hypothetical protein, partial [Elizabethkingia meningoseptica]